MSSPLLHEKVWFEKNKYDEAERLYFENLVKMKPSLKPIRIDSPSKKQTVSSVLDDDIPPPPPPPAVNRKDLPDLPPLHPCSPSCIVKEIILTGTANPQPPLLQLKDEKRLKPKEAKEKRNKADKKGRDRTTVNKNENKFAPGSIMNSPLLHEKVWFEKDKYDEAERLFYENLVKLLGIKNGIKNNRKALQPLTVTNAQMKPSLKPIRIDSPSKKQTVSSVLDDDIPPPPPPPAVNRKDLPDLPPLHPCSPSCIVKEIILTGTANPQPPLLQLKDEKRLKPKEAKEKRNKADKKGRDRTTVNKNENKGTPNTPNKMSLAGEVAKARQHIKHSLECMDGIAALATTANVEVASRVTSLEKDNAELKKYVEDLKTIIGKLQSRIDKLESRVQILDNSCGVVSSTVPCGAAAPDVTSAAPPVKVEVVDGDDADVDLFGSGSEEESDDAKKLKEARLAAYAAKKAKKPALIAKSNIILDVKPWDDETDMKLMEEAVRTISTDGLLWGASKLVPLAYGIHKLQISCVVEDEKVSVDWLQESIESMEDYVQSVDIAAFNKI